MLSKKILLAFSVLFLLESAKGRVARVVLIKGKVGRITADSKFIALSRGDLLDKGTTVQSQAKSFAKIVYNDKSQIILGPSSQIKIHGVLKGGINIISVLRGTLRAKVNKRGSEKNKSYFDKKVKLLLNTRTAALGVRGTDFQLSYNPENKMTALLTYSDVVAMSKIPDNIDRKTLTASKLNSILKESNTAYILEGKYSGTFPKFEKITYPSKISPSQFEALKFNEIPGLHSKKAEEKKYRSYIPDGVIAKVFNSFPRNLENRTEKIMGTSSYKKAIDNAIIKVPQGLDIDISPPEGSLDKNAHTFTPTAGGYVDFPTALYIPPPPGSLFNPNTGTYTPPKTMGTIDATNGRYIPPLGRELTASGELTIVDEKLAKTVPPPPVVKVVDMKTYKVAPNILNSLRTYINEMKVKSRKDKKMIDKEKNIEDEIEDIIDEIADETSEPDESFNEFNNDNIIVERPKDTKITFGAEVID